MTRSVGGLAGTNWAGRHETRGGPGIKTGGTSEATACSSRSESAGAGAGGAGGAPGGSQSHRTQWQPAESVGVGDDVPGRSHGALSPQQDAFDVPAVGTGGQQERFLAFGWQHDFVAGCGGAARSVSGIEGVLAGAAQAQARAGATAPIAVETASSRHTNERTRHRIGMKASYTRSIIAVNSIHRSAGKVVRTPLQSELFVCDPQCGAGRVAGRRFVIPLRQGFGRSRQPRYP